MIEKEVALYIKAEEESAMRQILEAYREGRIIILSEPPKPLLISDNTTDSDVYCPVCNRTLSGINSDWDENISVLQCPYCGTYLDSSTAISPKEQAGQDVQKLKLQYCEEIGQVHGCYFIENGQHCIDTGLGAVYRYATPDELLTQWYPTLVKENIRKDNSFWVNWTEVLRFIERTVIPGHLCAEEDGPIIFLNQRKGNEYV